MPEVFSTVLPCRSSNPLLRLPGGSALALAALMTMVSCAPRHGTAAAKNAAPVGPPTVAAARPTPRPVAPASVETPKEHRVGTVRVIGNGQRFVLVEVPPAGAGPLPDGQLLRCAMSPVADAPVTATLRVARERRQPFIVADVVVGEPHVGDAVYVDRSTPGAASDPTVLPTATSAVLPILLPGAAHPPSSH